ncbi:MAG: pyridoxamine 5'-phosphate oxidase [Ferruginibacter sp.]|nr:pyridoxamine 5'-phosphate oxidase [Ferruginibacter sp.]
MKKDIAGIRKDYQLKSLLEQDLASNPFKQFSKWWEEAVESEILEVNAMTLATATPSGMPNARIVLLKSFSDEGFVFFTNYNSKKGNELLENPHAALVFFWKELERQVRITGRVEKISNQDSDEYFQSRPVGSRIGAWASPQSKVIVSRDVIEKNILAAEEKFASGVIDRPLHWGGYVVMPTVIEFWQGRLNRLHDRLQYSLQQDGSWKIERLAP